MTAPPARVFIGSSVEGKPYAAAVGRALHELGCEPVFWWSSDVFPPGSTIVESLEVVSGTVDGALLIATPDDKTVRRGETILSPAMNVVLEYGFFAGYLGRFRTAVVRVEGTVLPSDLGGVVYISLPERADEDDETYAALSVDQPVAAWVRQRLASSNGEHLAAMVRRLAPTASAAERSRLKERIILEQLDPGHFTRLAEPELRGLLRRYVSRDDEGIPVGFEQKTVVPAYVDLTAVPPQSADAFAMANHLAAFVARLLTDGVVHASAIAISKAAASEVTRAAAARLNMPMLVVNPYGPNPRHHVEGFAEAGDQVLLLHDVAVSGHHLVDCVTCLRGAGLVAHSIAALVEYAVPGDGRAAAMEANSIRFHASTLFQADGDAARLPLHPFFTSPDSSCILCDVLCGAPDVPFRRLFTRSAIEDEILYAEDGFEVIGDVAPLAPGHILVVPSAHVTAVSLLPPSDLRALQGVLDRVRSDLEQHFRLPVIVFEHGACTSSDERSCGIDHAHVHAMPLRPEEVAGVVSAFEESFAPSSLSTLSELAERSIHDEYLLLGTGAGGYRVAGVERPKRQYFRQLIGELRGEELWSWADCVLLDDPDRARERLLEVRKVRFGPSGNMPSGLHPG